MTSRKALIIGAPDEKIPGVSADIENLRAYLKSPIGGVWRESEIITLISPLESEVKRQINLLQLNDYSLIFFAGHGFHSAQRNRTILHINSSQTMDSLDFRIGAQKHTLILDCCRKSEEEERFLKAAMESLTLDFAQGQKLDAAQCRMYFDKTISECDSGIVVMNSCSVDETAGEHKTIGGYYTSSLIDAANDWAKAQLTSINLAENYLMYSTQDCHNDAATQVKKLTGNRQSPNFESPRTKKQFPFSVIA